MVTSESPDIDLMKTTDKCEDCHKILKSDEIDKCK